MRPKPLTDLLNSVNKQLLYPDEILIVDGSRDELTKEALKNTSHENLRYYKVEEKDRGLTKQRNYGIARVASDIDVVCFLDDDIILEDTYFQKLIGTYREHPEAGGVGGFITNEVVWNRVKEGEKITEKQYESNGWVRALGSRNLLRKKLGLLSDKPPGVMPEFSNGLPVGFLPPTNETYPVEYFMGGVSSFRKEVVETIKFSKYFTGYGLYEDLEYCLRVSQKYDLYLNTSAKLAHYHDAGGRPNQYSYGRMVTRNGWLVWRTRYPKPSFKARVKWNLILLVLTFVKLTNMKSEGFGAFQQVLGRVSGWLSLLYNKPKA